MELDLVLLNVALTSPACIVAQHLVQSEDSTAQTTWVTVITTIYESKGHKKITRTILWPYVLCKTIE